ncbi:MAG: RnfABCDGE type electron transport complex subunit D [Desulfovibrionaceae bacterium]|jgi:electron transport complex protein RnfD|nr:RnfABCDGE type electron transport complex subunit D [Desulfovibrionaceae bacterium]
MSDPRFHVSVSPHLRDTATIGSIMWTVSAALAPQLVLAAWIFGPRVLLLAAVSVGSCVLCEAAMQRGLGKKVTVRDGSAVLTGLLLAYVLPPGVPLTLPFWGGVFAMCIAKHLFGGLGANFFNPALIARAFLAVGFPVAMTTAWIAPFAWHGAADAVSTATPLYLLKHYGAAAMFQQYGAHAEALRHFFLGIRPGCVGETSTLLLLLGGLVLIWRRIITWHIPAAMLGTAALLAWVFGGETLFTGDPLLHLVTGGMFLGAFFMATDYVTSPSQPRAKLLYGVGAGALTMLIRFKGGYPEGVCYAILLMNCLNPVIENAFRPKRFAAPLPKPEPKPAAKPEAKPAPDASQKDGEGRK